MQPHLSYITYQKFVPNFSGFWKTYFNQPKKTIGGIRSQKILKKLFFPKWTLFNRLSINFDQLNPLKMSSKFFLESTDLSIKLIWRNKFWGYTLLMISKCFEIRTQFFNLYFDQFNVLCIYISNLFNILRFFTFIINSKYFLADLSKQKCFVRRTVELRRRKVVYDPLWP